MAEKVPLMLPGKPQRLPEDVLAIAASLPEKPAPVRLEGRSVIVEPLDFDKHFDGLYLVQSGKAMALDEQRKVEAYDPEELLWKFNSIGPFNTPESFRVHLKKLESTPNLRPFCVVDRATDHPLGMTSLMSNFPDMLRIEIGYVWLGPIAHRTGANVEATYLLLSHAFSLGYRRVEWKCDSFNNLSQAAAVRCGFTFEGVQQCHMIRKGFSRDTAWFRMLNTEWPSIKVKIEDKLALYAANKKASD